MLDALLRNLHGNKFFVALDWVLARIDIEPFERHWMLMELDGNCG